MAQPLTPKRREQRRAASLRYYYSHKEKVQSANEAWWKAHPEKLREKWRRRTNSPSGKAKAKRHRERNLEKVRASRLEWQRKNWAHRQAYIKDYNKKNAERLKKQRAEYHRKNPGPSQVRRALKAGASISDLHLIKSWMAEVRAKPFGRCYWCGTKVPGRKIHFDHIIALHLKGAHSIGNLCVSCPECNLSKQKRAVADWICQGQTFLIL